jgi:nitrite reductase (NADH) small subunit
MTASRVAEPGWVDVCADTDVPVERGVVALVDGVQMALFRTHDGRLYGLANRDPFSGANVLARGIVGTRDGVPTVLSPMYKQAFDLRTGACLDDTTVRVATCAVRSCRGRVEVLL